MLGLTAAPIRKRSRGGRGPWRSIRWGIRKGWRKSGTRAAAIAGLHLAGNAYEGIGIPDCINTGRAAAKAALTSSS